MSIKKTFIAATAALTLSIAGFATTFNSQANPPNAPAPVAEKVESAPSNITATQIVNAPSKSDTPVIATANVDQVMPYAEFEKILISEGQQFYILSNNLLTYEQETKETMTLRYGQVLSMNADGEWYAFNINQEIDPKNPNASLTPDAKIHVVHKGTNGTFVNKRQYDPILSTVNFDDIDATQHDIQSLKGHVNARSYADILRAKFNLKQSIIFQGENSIQGSAHSVFTVLASNTGVITNILSTPSGASWSGRTGNDFSYTPSYVKYLNSPPPTSNTLALKN